MQFRAQNHGPLLLELLYCSVMRRKASAPASYGGAKSASAFAADAAAVRHRPWAARVGHGRFFGLVARALP